MTSQTAPPSPCVLHLLLVDDDVRYADYLRLMINGAGSGIALEAVTSLADGLRELATGRHDVCLLDYHLGGENGLDLLRRAQSMEAKVPIVLLTGDGDAALELAALEIGATDYLDKSEIDGARLLRCVQRSIARHRAELNLRSRERALAVNEQRYRSMVRNARHGIFEATTTGSFVAVNPALAEMLGYDEEEAVLAVGADIYESAEERERVLRELATAGGGNGIETTWKTQTGHHILVRISGQLARGSDGQHVIDGIVEDVTERARLGEQLRQAQKMEAVGQLAGGVAHDFNNLLTAILGYATLLRDRTTDTDARGDLDQIEQAAVTAAALTEQLLAFSRKQVLKPQVLSVNSVIARMDDLLSRLLGEDIRVVTELEPTIPDIEADPNQLQQVLLNLAVNARDAMPLGGRLTIKTSMGSVPADANVFRAISLPPGRYVVITVADEGCGMDAATRARIFEPFFSTKEQGKGTGLGLATVFGIVKQTGGEISCESVPGQGTIFRVVLPAAVARRTGQSAKERTTAITCSGTVLVVEDNAALRRLTCRILRSHGFHVLEAADPKAAFDIAQVSTFDLVLSDVVLPDMSGPQLVERLAAENPDIEVLFMSGFAGHPAINGGTTGDAPLLQKPFSPTALIGAVAGVLKHRRHSRSGTGALAG